MRSTIVVFRCLSYYGDVERGERNIALANILKIAAALEIPASQILARAEQLLREHG